MKPPAAADDDAWARVCELFEAARGLAPAERAPLLAACGDAAVRDEVAALLAADHDALRTPFLERLQPGPAAALLAPAAGETDDMDDIETGRTIGRYRVVRRLGYGGMGVVLLAHDPRLDRHVALKLLPPHLRLDATARARFEDEARAASALDHPNIVTVYEIGETEHDQLFIAMAFCAGETLRSELRAGAQPVARAVALATQIADALGAAHGRGIVHRDVKPANIIVTPDAVARLLDFGVAKIAGSALTHTALTPGTVAYMSPEQTRGDAVDARADVWALGVVLHELLTGRRPFEAADEQAMIDAIRNVEPEPVAGLRPDMPPGLCRIVERCLSKDPAHRPADGAAVAAALRAVTAETAAAALPPPTRRAVRRRRVLLVTGAAVIVVAGAFAARATTAPALEPRRVAVAPVENRTDMQELDELASMTGDWIAHLEVVRQ
jgi:eukaryotic-like serine/threonine-protein kinase